MNAEEKRAIAIKNLAKGRKVLAEKKAQEREQERIQQERIQQEQKTQERKAQEQHQEQKIQEQKQEESSLESEEAPNISPKKRERPFPRLYRYQFEEEEPPEKKQKTNEPPQVDPPVPVTDPVVPTGIGHELATSGIKIATALALFFVSTATATYAQRTRSAPPPSAKRAPNDYEMWMRD